MWSFATQLLLVPLCRMRSETECDANPLFAAMGRTDRRLIMQLVSARGGGRRHRGEAASSDAERQEAQEKTEVKPPAHQSECCATAFICSAI